MTGNLSFFLGGHDLEMITIKEMLALHRPHCKVFDKGLSWGAMQSDYRHEMAASAAGGDVIVCVELGLDLELPTTTIIVDHHGARSQEPSSLKQVFDIVALPQEAWTRHYDLVSANDTGHIVAMRAFGASHDEIMRIRAQDRAAQGITQAEESEGLAALEMAQPLLDNQILVVKLPHGRTATVADPLAIANDPRDLLVRSPLATNFFGLKSRIACLDSVFPGGWSGGGGDQRGFWGIGQALPLEALIPALTPRELKD
jgi:hypothetical protein